VVSHGSWLGKDVNMKRFRFISEGIAPQTRKSWLSQAASSLPHIFTDADIKPGMFSPSLEKRLRQAKKHGTKIVLRRHRWQMVGVQVVNKEDHKVDMKKRNSKIRSLRKELNWLTSNAYVKLFVKDIKELAHILPLANDERGFANLLEQIK
jgi:hypothetical protein